MMKTGWVMVCGALLNIKKGDAHLTWTQLRGSLQDTRVHIYPNFNQQRHRRWTQIETQDTHKTSYQKKTLIKQN